jgi:hypothetical protein
VATPGHGGYHNPGFPGCCRAPAPHELKLIQPAEWPAVSIIHDIPIPPDIKALLDSVSQRGGPIAALVSLASRTSSGQPQLDRKNSSSGGSSSKNNSPRSKTLPLCIPNKVRSGGSPQQTSAPLSGTSSRLTGGAPSSFDYRRLEQGEKRADAPYPAHSSPTQKPAQAELEAATTKRPFTRRTTVSNVAPSLPSAKPAADILLTHRASNASTTSVPNKSLPARGLDRQPPLLLVRTDSERAVVDEPTIPSPSSASSSGGSSDSYSSGSLTDCTVTSEGGFTDYLSEESDRELQRQAEAKAYLLAQNHAEEHEFRVARQQLANVDLHPPRSWKPPTTTINAPRAAAPSTSYAPPNAVYTNPTLTSTAGSQPRA